jgi:Raf kinase inhibitor-like YbhB/YbcL family protein
MLGDGFDTAKSGRAGLWVVIIGILIAIVFIGLISRPTKDTIIPPQVAEPEGGIQAEDATLPPDEIPVLPGGLYNETMSEFSITSSAFADNESIPPEYTADGRNVNPPLSISDIPDGTVSLALIMDDPDAPVGTWDHWIMWNIPPAASEIATGSVPAGAVQGANGWGRSEYGGPSPPSGTHRYVFKLYALDSALDLEPGAKKAAVERSMEGRIIAQTKLTGLYSRGG